MLPLWSSLSISTSSRFSGTTSSSTCTLFASLQLGMAGKASSFTGWACASNRANCGASDFGAVLNAGAGAGGAGLKVGAGAGAGRKVGGAWD